MQILFLRITLFSTTFKREGGRGCCQHVGCEFVFTIIEIPCIPKQLTNFYQSRPTGFFFSDCCMVYSLSVFWILSQVILLKETTCIFSTSLQTGLIFENFNIVRKKPGNDEAVHIDFRVLWLNLYLLSYILVVHLHLWHHGLILKIASVVFTKSVPSSAPSIFLITSKWNKRKKKMGGHW